MDKVTINKAVVIRYVASNFTTGLTDLLISVRKPNGDILTPAPVFVEIGESGNYDGVYEASYTPNVLGTWQEKITSATNSDRIIRSHDVVAYDVQDVKSQLDTVEGKVDDVKTVVDSTETKVDDVKAVVDNLALAINPGGYFA
jgi:hypothetical protein